MTTHFNRLPRAQLDPLPRGIALEGIQMTSRNTSNNHSHGTLVRPNANQRQRLTTINSRRPQRDRSNNITTTTTAFPHSNSNNNNNSIGMAAGDLTMEDANCVRQLLRRNRNSQLLASLEPYFDAIATQSAALDRPPRGAFHLDNSDRFAVFNEDDAPLESATPPIASSTSTSYKCSADDSDSLDRSQLPENNDPQFPKAFLCPITLLVMVDPCVAADGHTYERSAITTWLLKNNKSPMTGIMMESTQLMPNFAIKSMIGEHLQKMKPIYEERSRDANKHSHT